MNDIEFFSDNRYLFLPTRCYPKVALCINNRECIYNSFKLYNPFSVKAKVFKKFMYWLVTYCGFITKFITYKHKKTDFIHYLENLLNKKLYVSVYYATANDKVVLQLQTENSKVVGYVKYPISTIGVSRIKNEIKAFNILSSKEIIKSYMLKGTYKGQPFIILSELDGKIDIVNDEVIKLLLSKFIRNKKYTLEQHPRILSIKRNLKFLKMDSEFSILDSILKKSKKKYELVYEHGDFTPWNIVRVGDEYVPFDFEYFIEDGLEYFDMIKYYYQIGSLLLKKVNGDLKDYVLGQIDVEEIESIYELFLIKEKVLLKMEE